jgi:ribosomal protein L40E
MQGVRFWVGNGGLDGYCEVVKTCVDCGEANEDDATMCRECQGTSFKTESKESEEPENSVALEFEPLDPKNMDKMWVTLIRCQTLPAADAIAMELRAANIPVFLPDEYAMQALSININAYGWVRVQVPPSEYRNARELLEG